MIKVLAVCGNGMGTSLVIKMKVKKFLDANKIKAEMNSCSIGESKGYLSQGIDIALCSQHLAKEMTAPPRTHIIGLKNLMDEKEFGPKILEIVKEFYPNEME